MSKQISSPEKTKSTTYRVKPEVLTEFSLIAERAGVTTSWLLDRVIPPFLMIFNLAHPLGLVEFSKVARDFIDHIKSKTNPKRAPKGSTDVKVPLSVTIRIPSIEKITHYANITGITPSNLIQNIMEIFIEEHKLQKTFSLVSMAITLERICNKDNELSLEEWLTLLKSRA